MNEDRLDELTDEIKDTISDAIADLSLEDAIEVVESVSSEMKFMAEALKDDLQRQG